MGGEGAKGEVVVVLEVQELLVLQDNRRGRGREREVERRLRLRRDCRGLARLGLRREGDDCCWLGGME